MRIPLNKHQALSAVGDSDEHQEFISEFIDALRDAMNDMMRRGLELKLHPGEVACLGLAALTHVTGEAVSTAVRAGYEDDREQHFPQEDFDQLRHELHEVLQQTITAHQSVQHTAN
jgi:hypothetical protein